MDALIHKDIIQEFLKKPEPVETVPTTGTTVDSIETGRNRTIAGNCTLAAAGAFAILVLALVAYLPILPGQFIMDDRRLVETDNPLVNGQLGFSTVWFQTDFALSTVAFWLQWLAWDVHPGGYHAVNIILHATSAILLWRLLAKLGMPGAWLAGAIFAVHPVAAASVGRIAELKNTLSLPFFLLSAWFYVHHEDSNEGTKRNASYAMALVAFVLALLAKTTTAVLPVLLLLLAWFRRGRITRRDLVYTSPFLVIGATFGLMSAWFQKHQALAGQVLVPETFGERLAIAGRAFWFYLEKAVLPIQLNLVYPLWKMDASSWLAYLPVVAFVAVLAICWRIRTKTSAAVALGLIAFLAALFPSLGFLDAQFMTRWQVSDHLQYLALIVPITLAAARLATFLPVKIFRGAALLIVIGFGLLTYQRAQAYANPEKLFRDALAKNPAAWAAQNDLGAILAARSDYTGAAKEFEASLVTNPDDNPDALSNLGQVEMLQGKMADAESRLRQAVKLKPLDAQVHRNFASVLGRNGKPDEAVKQLATAVSIKPDTQMRMDLAMLRLQSGDPARAAEQYRQVLKTDPDKVEALNNLAFFLATASDDKLRDGAQAVQLSQRAIKLPPVKGMCVEGTLAAAYAESGNFEKAVTTAEEAVRTETANGETRFADLNSQLLQLYRAGKPFHGTMVKQEHQFGISEKHQP